MRTCLKGHPMQENQQFCAECGSPMLQENNYTLPQKKRSYTLPIVLTILGLAVILTGGFFAFRQYFTSSNDVVIEEKSASSSNQAATQSSDTDKDKTDESEASTASSSKKVSGPQLDAANLTPKQNAASILVYGAEKLQDSLWKGNLDSSKKNSALDVSLSDISEDSNSISKPGMGTYYSLAPGEVDSSIGYTLETNQTVNFYKQGPSMSSPYILLGSVPIEDIVDWVNNNNQVTTVNNIASATKIYG
ncbi:hypothetical protein [Ligilactobacillus hayakitensis]|nr:hypothetical protein [Ligilactobacillus hayakitensis]